MPDHVKKTLQRVATAFSQLPDDVQLEVVEKVEFGANMFRAGFDAGKAVPETKTDSDPEKDD